MSDYRQCWVVFDYSPDIQCILASDHEDANLSIQEVFSRTLWNFTKSACFFLFYTNLVVWPNVCDQGHAGYWKLFCGANHAQFTCMKKYNQQFWNEDEEAWETMKMFCPEKRSIRNFEKSLVDM